MTYIVNFTDSNNKAPISVFDNSSNSTSTSLTFPGRNVTGYGQIVAENFLHLLENFAAATAPNNPVEGQVWYDNINGILNLYDNTSWKAASGIQKGPTQPSVATSKVGELWVDTANQQLRIFTGSRWILVGPSQSTIDGLRYGPSVETIADTDNIDRTILVLYIADVPVVIVSKDSFTPKLTINGFLSVKSGVNINTPASTAQQAIFGVYKPKFYGTATNADALNINGLPVDAGVFLRSDQINTTSFGINVKNSSGITLGSDSTFKLGTSATAATIYNSQTGSSIDLQTNLNGIPTTVLRVINNKVGINVSVPNNTLDIDGTLGITGVIKSSNTTVSTSLSTGSIITAGGIAVSQNILVGTDITVNGKTITHNQQPITTDLYDSGTSIARWANVRAKNIIADTIQGTLTGNIQGNANTATALFQSTYFSLAGDVVSQTIQFDGQVGTQNKVFNTSLTANIIKAKNEPSPNVSTKSDYVLVYRSSLESGTNSGLVKQTRDVFVGDLGMPIGGIIPYAGLTAPYGYLLCDGSEVEIAKYPDLYNVVGNTYNGTDALVGVRTFRLPDLRGRFPLGRDNMDNSLTVPNSIGGFVSAGGGTAGNVQDTKAQTLGGTAGQSSTTISLSNLPDHEHSLIKNGIQYAAVRVDTAINPPGVTGLGPTAPGQAQYLQESGGVLLPNSAYQLGQPIGIMNPYQTMNYIIRSGPPLFTTTLG